MTAKQLEFCQEYERTNDKVKAYQTVYKCSLSQAKLRAEELYDKDTIQDYFAKKQQKPLVDSHFVIANLKDIASNSQKEADRLRALELLAKFIGMANTTESELVIKIDY